ncbi:MAG TPA: hypothetical protein VLE89_06360 [Chlamydiales bacterium]|nr:hypothetical protein [Chlamydiales bacterium]
MREWIDELSDWMQKREKIAHPLSDLEEEVNQAALETDSLLQASDQLQSVYSQLLGKVDHVSSK